MNWIAGVFAGIVVLFSSIFGAHTTPSNLMPTQGNAPQQTTNTTYNTNVPSTINTSGSIPSGASTDALMHQIGCSDATSCAAACGSKAPVAACDQLRTLMSSQISQGRSSSAYTRGSPSGPSSDVAFVGNGTAANAGDLPACPSSNAVFDTSPIQTSDLSGIEPLGHMNGEHILPNQADHVYMISNSDATVYAPGNATLLQVNEQVGVAGADQGTNSVKLYFSPCKNLMFAFQINTLSPQLASALSKIQPTGSQTGATVRNTIYGSLNIPITSGEALGTVTALGGVGGQADFAAADMRTAPLQFIDQEEATGMLANSYQHAVCPLDYFSATVRSALYSRLTMKNAGSNGIPACGSVMQDKAGTAQGNWYDKSAPAPSYQGINEGALLAIVHSNLDPTQGVVSVGTDLIPSSYLGTQIMFQPTSSGYINREPSQITPDGNVYCFDGAAGPGSNGSEGHVDIKLESVTKLAADYASGACVAIPTLTASALTYER